MTKSIVPSIKLRRPPLPAQELTVYSTVFGNNGYVVLQSNSSLQMLVGNRQALADKLRELANDLESVTVDQMEVIQ